MTHIPKGTLVFDIETDALHGKSKPAVAVAWAFGPMPAFRVYTASSMAALVGDINAADRVVGWNHVGFDYAVLARAGHVVTQKTNVDLCKLLGRVSLDSAAKAELGYGKRLDSRSIPKLLAAGRIEEVVEECQLHVTLTRDLYVRLWKFQRIRLMNKTGARYLATVARDALRGSPCRARATTKKGGKLW